MKILGKNVSYNKVGRFFIKKVKGIKNPKLDLFKNTKLNLIYYLFLLKQTDG